ncbi:DUF885 domain-containing protein [Streptantibioticus silvisoli]|uniref:DUF885 domain-containing protein n=1 Tax=Streptantibioticus silvisoli TaxID=2705255 RepID=A0ABT6W733_9ACTN|nr:DUF885 domain-containing protein [Streptantibioticus silvisoli]MDI5966552.1 DUF885 domain-containing protein [Streptantibioticus silvisoli]
MSDEQMTPRHVADGYVDRMAALDPETGLALGIGAVDDRQPDLTPDGFAAREEVARQTLAALDALPAAAADAPQEAACARLLRERLTARLQWYEAGEHYRQVQNLSSPVHGVRQVLTLSATRTDEDWALVAGRLRNVPAALDGYRVTLGEGIGRGLLAAPRQAEVMREQLAAWTGLDDGGPGWFAGLVAPGPEGMRAELDAAAARATEAVVAFRAWLGEVYAPAAEGTPDAVGRERYRRHARQATGADLDLDEAYGWAWAQFHENLEQMRGEAGRVLPGASPLEAMGHLNAQGHAITGRENVRVWLQGIMDEAVGALDGEHFDITGPLRRVESCLAPPGTAAAPYYMGPSLDFARPGRTYLPAMGRERFPTWQLVSTWYHEGVPGHHLQIASWTASAGSLSRYQVTLGRISADVEGWALYAERLMNDLGYLTDPARRLGYLDKQMLRIIRVIVDIGMHLELPIPADSGFHPGERWTPALAEAFMAAHHGSPAGRRSSEIIRYLGRPGQAIGYKLGERAWLTGREAARRRHGAAFDLKTWHMKALVQGSFGLDDLADNLASL